MTKIKKKISELLKDTSDGSSITYDDQNNIFVSKSKKFNNEGTISNFFINDYNTDDVPLNKNLYEDVKFPNYDDLKTYGDLIEKAAQQSHLASLLDKSIKHSSKILE